MTNGARRYADRTKQIDGVTVVVARPLPIVRRNDRRYLRSRAMLDSPAVDRMNVTKRQADVNGERNQRQPRTTPDMVTKPTHSGRADYRQTSPEQPF
jgi:hypothetical protein